MAATIDRNRRLLLQIRKELLRYRPQERIEERRLFLDIINERLVRALMGQLKSERQQLINIKTRIEAMSPVNVLKKGYVRVTDNYDKSVVSVAGLQVDQPVTLHFVDGQAKARIQSTKETR